MSSSTNSLKCPPISKTLLVLIILVNVSNASQEPLRYHIQNKEEPFGWDSVYRLIVGTILMFGISMAMISIGFLGWAAVCAGLGGIIGVCEKVSHRWCRTLPATAHQHKRKHSV